MTSPIKAIDLTPRGLFPDKDNALQDPKCLVIAEVISQIAAHALCPPTIEQEEWQEIARKRYALLSEPKKLSVLEISRILFLLLEKGVNLPTARQYISFFPYAEEPKPQSEQ